MHLTVAEKYRNVAWAMARTKCPYEGSCLLKSVWFKALFSSSRLLAAVLLPACTCFLLITNAALFCFVGSLAPPAASLGAAAAWLCSTHAVFSASFVCNAFEECLSASGCGVDR